MCKEREWKRDEKVLNFLFLTKKVLERIFLNFKLNFSINPLLYAGWIFYGNS